MFIPPRLDKNNKYQFIIVRYCDTLPFCYKQKQLATHVQEKKNLNGITKMTQYFKYNK